MATVRNIFVAILLISFFTFVAFFGRLPALRNTPIGFLHRILWIHIPRLCRRLDQTITGGRFGPSVSSFGHYLLHEKHFLVTIFFLGLVTASAILILFEIWSTLSVTHRVTVIILLPQPYLFTYLAASTSANPNLLVNISSHAEQMSRYPYDYTLFHPNIKCRTCRHVKPARSKHCSICKACIARADHHCVWVNNCLGRGNYRWFLALLLSTSILLFYGAYLSYTTLAPLVASPDRFDAYMATLQTAINVGGISVAGVGLLAALTSPLPLCLLAYHIYLVWAGTTTNESGKWADLRDDMRDGVVWAADLVPSSASSTTPNDSHDADDKANASSEDEVDEFAWPISSRLCVVRTSDGKVPGRLPPALERLVDASSWRRAWRLAQMENIYDLGFWDNLMHVLLD